MIKLEEIEWEVLPDGADRILRGTLDGVTYQTPIFWEEGPDGLEEGKVTISKVFRMGERKRDI